MSELGLGLAALGRPAYINVGHAADVGPEPSVDDLRARTHAVLDVAWAEGVRAFDAARSYGLAEAFLGEWLRSRAPAGAFVSSKWGYAYTAGWRTDAEAHEVKALTLEQLERQLAETRAALPQLDLYQIHSATLESGVLEDAGVLGALAALRAEGVGVGLSVTGARQAATVEAAVASGAFDAVQATWNLHERSAEAALESAHAAGMRVIVKEAMANGRLAGDAAPAPLREAAAERGTTPDALALAAALAQPWAGVVLSGAATEATLRSNLRARDADVAGLDLGALREAPEAYWKTRAALPWN